MFDLEAAGYSTPPTLVVGSDGVGTKLLIAQAMGKHDTIGQDLAAMLCNDIICQGAEVRFLIYFSSRRTKYSGCKGEVRSIAPRRDGCFCSL